MKSVKNIILIMWKLRNYFKKKAVILKNIRNIAI